MNKQGAMESHDEQQDGSSHSSAVERDHAVAPTHGTTATAAGSTTDTPGIILQLPHHDGITTTDAGIIPHETDDIDDILGLGRLPGVLGESYREHGPFLVFQRRAWK